MQLMRFNDINEQSNCITFNHIEAPVTSTALAENVTNENNPFQEQISQCESEGSSIRSSQNQSPVSIVSSLESVSTATSTNDNINTNLVDNNLQYESSFANANNTGVTTSQHQKHNNEWPFIFSRLSALLCCTLGLFNISRFAVLTVNYGGNFLLQFVILSIIFGIPLFWLQMCLGAKIKAGPISMWKISPICQGIGIGLVLIQCFMAIYSTVVIAWLFVYVRDSFPNRTKAQLILQWQDDTSNFEQLLHNNSLDITKIVADYFNVNVLQRTHLNGNTNGIKFQVSEELVFYLALIWLTVFLILCKGLKSFGNAVLVVSIVPLLTLITVTCKFLSVLDFSKIQNIFPSDDFDEFLLNSKTWIAAAQETFLTWGLLGPSVIAVTSRINKHSVNCETVLRREAIFSVILTIVGLSVAALLGLCCLFILKTNNCIYVPGSYESLSSSHSVFSLIATISPDLLSFPPNLVPHYSSFVGETYSRSIHFYKVSGYQALRFISELLPATLIFCGKSISWIWIVIVFITLILFGLGQLCIMWLTISKMLGNSMSSILLSCFIGLLLSIPFTTEVGISILHFMDLLIGGAWILPIFWAALIFGVFLIRGRPYNGDELVNDLKMSGTLSAFLALSWNVFLPIGLITFATIEYKCSLSSQFYNWRSKSYFDNWAQKGAGLIQISIVLLIPFVSLIQICRYLRKGPPDILDRIRLLYRPSDLSTENRRNFTTRNMENSSDLLRNPSHANNLNSNVRESQNDAPPKYTPPPSYTTATGARLAKIFRQSIRRSVRRILRGSDATRLTSDTEMIESICPPNYSNATDSSLSGNINHNQSISEITETDMRLLSNRVMERSASLGRHTLANKSHQKIRRPFTAEDVITILRSSNQTSFHLQQPQSSEVHLYNNSSFHSVENLILNAEPPDQSEAIIASINTNETN